MKRALKTVAFALALMPTVAAASSAYENPILGFPHLLASPYTLPAGRFILGTDVGFGVSDSLQVGTNLFSDIEQVFNANAKFSVLDFPGFAFALTGAVQSYNLQAIDPLASSVQITSYMPGAVAGVALVRELGVLVGGNLSLSSDTANQGAQSATAYTRGATAESDLSWAAVTKKDWPVFVLSGGASYDFTYRLAGVGLSFHFKGLHAGLHYYPSAAQHGVLPILAGGAVVDI